ncbi:MAG: hypothetical protein A2173_01005, partial [Planctomycetes bacterium RBG_13_44_8b]
MFELDNISTFLFFGYLPKLPDDLENKEWVINTTKENCLSVKEHTEEDLLNSGIRIFKSIFTGIEDGKHVVFLSGGLDSRGLLGGLLSAGKKDQITTVTYGTPGTFDFDIGCDVARRMSLHNERIDLTQIKIEQSLLEETARKMEIKAWLFDAFYRRLIHKRFDKDAIYWSGFFGDILSGRHQTLKENVACEEAISHFIEHNRFVKSVDLASPDFDPASVLPRPPFLRDSILNYDRQMEFVLRQESYMKHILIPNGYNYHTPYLHPDWIKFFLNAPLKLRRGQYLYRKILMAAFPDLFSLPVRNNFGASLGAPDWKIILKKNFLRVKNIIGNRYPFCLSHCDPKVNYIDFNEAIRRRKDFKEVVSGNIHDLKKRGIIDWIDIEDLLIQHQRRRINCADAI